VIFVSAETDFEIDRMLNGAVKLNRLLDTKIPTSKLNACIARLVERVPPPAIANRRFKIYYATQTGNRPFRFRIFCNREEKLPESYRRYLEAGIVKEFDLHGCPMLFKLIGKERHKDRGKNGPLRKKADPDAADDGIDEDIWDDEGFDTIED
jgi:GTP-binding protein